MEEQHHDDQSHYEISLTAGQAFVAFVLLLLSLAASFAFGLMIGKGQGDDRLVVRKETPVITEASIVPKKSEGKIVELGVEEDAEVQDATTDTTTVAPAPTIIEEGGAAPASGAEVTTQAPPVAAEAAAATPTPAAAPPPVLNVTTYAQLLSTGDQKTAETLAARLIDGGFRTAYVERGATDKGPVFRVRVKFNSETDARAAEAKLKEFSKDVWITSR